MYNFFDLPIDEFYIQNLSSRYTDWDETIETTIKVIRVYLFGMTTEEFAKMLGMSKSSRNSSRWIFSKKFLIKKILQNVVEIDQLNSDSLI